MKNKGNIVLWITLVVAGAVLAIGAITGVKYLTQKPAEQAPPVSFPQPAPTAPEVVQPSQAQDETANWITYRSGRYGFEFKFPPSITTIEEFVGTTGYAILLRSKALNADLDINTDKNLYGSFTVPVAEEKLISAGGASINLEIRDSSDPAEKLRQVFVEFEKFSKNNNSFFMYFTYDKNQPNKLDVVKDILSTFKLYSPQRGGGAI